MKTNTYKFLGKLGLFGAVLLLIILVAPMVLAQGGPGSGSGQGDQDRDRIQDPATHDGDEPDQDRDRLHEDGEPDQDRLQTQDRDRLQDGTGDGEPDQDRDRVQDRDRIHVDSVEYLEDFLEVQNRTRLENGEMNQVRTRVEAQIAAEAVEMAEPMLGQNGPRMSDMARQMNQAMSGFANNEEALQNRTRLQLFLFGHDDEVLTQMNQAMENNQNRIEELKQYMFDCSDCDTGATQVLVNQVQNMEREQVRLQEVYAEAANRKGLFGFLFGWIR